MVNNYFKIGKSQFVFFDDTFAELRSDAFESATKISREYPQSRISVFRLTSELATFTRFVVGESPELSPYQEVTQWTSTGWVTRARDLGQKMEEMS